MATFTGNFDITQNSESTITLTDSSTGSDPTITSRTITIRTFDNQLFGDSPYTWNIADSSITLTDLLLQDQALNIRVDWNTPTPDPSNTYTITKLAEFDYYDLIFIGQLIAEKMARNPSIVNDTNYMNRFFELYSYIVSARISIGLMNDIFKGQLSLDSATYMRNNQNLLF